MWVKMREFEAGRFERNSRGKRSKNERGRWRS